jgi:Family of unknown function (DUF5684)
VQTYGILKTVGRQWWWLLLIYLLPCIGLIFFIIVMNDLSTSFAKGGGFTVGLVFLFGIFLFILGYGSAEYHGPIASIPPGLPPGDLAP